MGRRRRKPRGGILGITDVVEAAAPKITKAAVRRAKTQREIDRLLKPVRTVAKAADRAAQHERDVAVADVIDRHSAGLSSTAFVSKSTAAKLKKDLSRKQMIRARQEARRRKLLGSPMGRSFSTILNIPTGGAMFLGYGAQDVKDLFAEGDWTPERTGRLLKEVGIGTYESIKDPGHDPAAFLLSVFGAASLGAGSVAKLSVVSRLAKEGRYAEAAVALGRRPPPGPRVLRTPEGHEVRFPGGYSRSALSEGWQRAWDFYRMKAAAARPGGRANRRLDVLIERQQRKRDIALQAIEEGEVANLRRHNLTTPQQLAIQMFGENSPPRARIATLMRALEKEKHPYWRADIKTRILLHERAAAYLAEDAAGNVILSGKKRKKLEAAVEDSQYVSDLGGNIKVQVGAISPGQATFRVNAPGRVDRGAEWVEPTPSRTGVESPTLRAKRSRVERLAARHEAALERQRGKAVQSHTLVDESGNEVALANPYEPRTAMDRPRTAEEAQGRLTELTKILDELIRNRMAQLMPPEFRAAEALRRNRENARRRRLRESGESGQRKMLNPQEGKFRRDLEAEAESSDWRYTEGGDLSPLDTVLSELERDAGMGLYKWADESSSPEAAKMRQMLDEIEQLEAALEGVQGAGMSPTERAIFVEEGPRVGRSGEPVTPSLGTVREPGDVGAIPTDMPPDILIRGENPESIYQPSVQRLGGALSVARDELAAAEAAAARRIEPTGLVGGEGGQPGRFRVPHKPAYGTRTPRFAVGGNFRVQFEPTPMGSTTHPHTGALLRSGRYRMAVTKLIADDAIEAMKYRRALRLIEAYKDVARPYKVADDDIAVRLNPTLTDEVRELLNRSEQEGRVLTRDDRKALGAAYDDFYEQAFPKSPSDAEVLAGEVGYIPRRWLTGRMLAGKIPMGGARHLKVHGYIPILDDLNNAARLAVLYSKIGYIPPNFLGNVLLNWIQQGFLAGPNLLRAAADARHSTKSDSAWRHTLMGSGIAKSLALETHGPLAWSTRKAANILSYPTDLFTRDASLLYEFGRRGYGSSKKRAELRRRANEGDAEAQEHLIEIVTRARENAIEYEMLTKFEKDVIQRIVFVYAWGKGSTTYTGRFLRDHPIQASAYYQLGVIGKEEADRYWGPRPSYMEGIVPAETLGIGGGKDEKRGTAPGFDPRGIMPWTTALDAAGVPVSALKGQFPTRFIPAEFLSPLEQITAGWIHRFNPQTRTPLEGQQGFLDYLNNAFVQTLPPVQLYKGIRGDIPDENRLVQRSVGEQRLRGLLGSAGQTTYSIPALNAAAEDEALDLKTLPFRAVYRVRKERDAFEQELLRVGATDYLSEGGLSPNVKLAFQHKEMREAVIAPIQPKRRATRKQKVEYQLERFAAEHALALRLGRTPNSDPEGLRKWAKGDLDKIRKHRRDFADIYLGIGYLKGLKAHIREHGADSFMRNYED